ncbi:hypothetical protein [Actinomadura sp. 6K520]|uniref:hypothetical protein n=1 Tax=Actinomadura sp. 6K520 TaxID=2530364 RepID=UPI0010452021|nr:hypothetical protein [Actinomadura sp. 6K520]TDE32012.1 hypothetical protein E1289_16995 [Actinomadura sp. 6K520]
MTVEPRETCTGRVPGEDDVTTLDMTTLDMTTLDMTTLDMTTLDMTGLGADPPRDPMPVVMSGELAARVRVLRRARRDAETRASRVRRVLLAPTAPAGGTHLRAPNPHRH